VSIYTYTIFDANPNTSSGTAWPSHEDIEIEAESDAEALGAVRDVMSTEAAGLNASDGYDVGQRLYALVWDADTVIVGEPTYELTAEDLGVEADDDLVTIEEMPEHLRGSHRAAGNWGRYPHNGATRRQVSRDEADEIVSGDADEYARIVD
jgi:hypothetical protein